MQLTLRESGRKLGMEIYAEVDSRLGWKAQMRRWKDAAAREPSRAAMDSGPPTDCDQIEIQKFASSKCKTCSGKGYRLVADVRKEAKASPVPCSCAEKGYKKFMAERIKMPCKVCGGIGWCDHRPQTLAQIFQIVFMKSMAQLLAAGGEIPKSLQSEPLMRALFGGAQDDRAKKGNRQDKRGPQEGSRRPSRGDADGEVEGRGSVLPGLQPGSSDS